MTPKVNPYWYLACALNISLAAAPALGEGLVFTEVSRDTVLALTDQLNESVAWGDYDNDGDQDLYLTNSTENRLFRNDGDGVFTDVTDVAGVGHPGFSVGTAFGDLDNDGDLDLYVVNFSSGADVLYRNDGPVGPEGEYVFSDVTADAGTTIERSSRGMAFLDYDQDGLLDIYVMAIGENILYHNLGDLQFEDVAAELGVNASHTGVGVVCTDVDNNGWLDIYTGNRSGAISSLYLNEGGTFTDIAAAAGLAAAGLGMGVLSFDYDNDLDFDLYWTTWPGDPATPNALYENIDGLTFVDVAEDSGTTDVPGWGISCNAGDVDNDGWQDFFVTNGFSADTGPNVLFHNQQDGTFADVSATLGDVGFDGRGVAFADYDNDGDLDLVVTADAGDDTRLWRNDTDNGYHWITLNLMGTLSNRSAIGARVEVSTSVRTTVQEVSGGAGRGSQNSLPLEFGLGEADLVEQITIRWPSQGWQTMFDVDVDQILTITEPRWGDLNCDGVVDFFDIDAFVMAVTDPAGYAATYPGCDPAGGDINGDGFVDFFDIDGFVTLVAGG